MHEQYGDVVRFGPNMVSISDPSVISTVYPMRAGFPKVRVYLMYCPAKRLEALLDHQLYLPVDFLWRSLGEEEAKVH